MGTKAVHTDRCGKTENYKRKKKNVLISQDVVGDPETEITDIIAFFCLCDEVKIPVSVLCFLALKKICR